MAALGMVPSGAARAADPSPPPAVAAVKVACGDLSKHASFDAELRPYQETELHARVTGYLEDIQVDVGDLVRENQLIATLDQPELKSEIDHALAVARRTKAEIEHAQAAFEDAHLSYTRLTTVSEAQPNLIAQQDIDAARAKDRSAAAALNAAREQDRVAETDVNRLKIMQNYTRIVAPFSGAVTKRYSNLGALIQAGTSTGSLPLVRLSQIDRLRAVFPVSISYVANIKIGDPVEIRIAVLKRTIQGRVERFNRKIETATRTMDVEVDVPNPDLSIIPGMYATAQLRTEHRPKALFAPVEAVTRDKNGGASVFVISREGKVEERQVNTGIETPLQIEILNGVNVDELIMIGGRSQVKPGQMVTPKLEPTAEAGGTKPSAVAAPPTPHPA